QLLLHGRFDCDADVVVDQFAQRDGLKLLSSHSFPDTLAHGAFLRWPPCGPGRTQRLGQSALCRCGTLRTMRGHGSADDDVEATRAEELPRGENPVQIITTTVHAHTAPRLKRCCADNGCQPSVGKACCDNGHNSFSGQSTNVRSHARWLKNAR